MSWHVTSFEERLEKALSEEKLLSERSVGFFLNFALYFIIIKLCIALMS